MVKEHVIRMSLLRYTRAKIYFVNLMEIKTLVAHGRGGEEPNNLASDRVVGLGRDGRRKKNGEFRTVRNEGIIVNLKPLLCLYQTN
jgi:hypothetical protein